MKYLCKLILIFDCGHPIYYISLCLLVQCVPLMWNSFHFLFLKEMRTHFGDTHYITYKSTNIYTKKYVTFCLTSEHHENDNQRFNDLTFDKDTLLTDLHLLSSRIFLNHTHSRAANELIKLWESTRYNATIHQLCPGLKLVSCLSIKLSSQDITAEQSHTVYMTLLCTQLCPLCLSSSDLPLTETFHVWLSPSSALALYFIRMFDIPCKYCSIFAFL